MKFSKANDAKGLSTPYAPASGGYFLSLRDNALYPPLAEGGIRSDNGGCREVGGIVHRFVKHCSWVVVGLVFCFLAPACNQKSSTETTREVATPTGTSMYSDTASSSVRVFDQNGKVCIQQSNTYYELVDAYEGANKIQLLLKIKKTELCFADSVNRDKVYEISAKSIMDTKQVAWNAQFVATNLQFKDNSVLANHEGAVGEEDYLLRLSLLNGKEVFGGSYGELRIAIPNVRDKWFIGYTSAKAAGNPLNELKGENLLGVVRFGSSAGSLNVLKIKLKRSNVAAKIPTGTPDIILVAANANATVIEDGKSLILMKADEHYQAADIKDFSVKLTFYYGDDNEATHIIIPIVNGALDGAHAKFDGEIFEVM